MSVVLFDCSRSRFDLEQSITEIDEGLYTYKDLTRMLPPFLEYHPHRIGALDAGWNSFDVREPSTKLLHYTGLHSQPWKFPGHPHGEVWFRYFFEALEAGAITETEVEDARRHFSVRRDIMKGNSPRGKGPVRRAARYLRSALRGK